MPRQVSGLCTVDGNPQVQGTVITSNWANFMMDDIALMLTDSLSRSGSGGMSSPLQFADGTESAPGAAFTQEPNTGMYHVAGSTGDLRFVTKTYGDTFRIFEGGVYVWNTVSLAWDALSTTTGTVTPSSTDTFTNKSGSNLQWTNDAGYSTTAGTVTPSSTDTFTNKSGAISQWTNDSGYSTTTGTVTPSSTDTFTNKSGAISQWTNDSGYLTTAYVLPVASSTVLGGVEIFSDVVQSVAANAVTATASKTYGVQLDSSGRSVVNVPWASGGGIALTDLSAVVTAVGTANLSYDNTTGVFTYTPPDLTTYVTAASATAFTNKTGAISQWTNDSGYSTTTGTVTPSSTDTFTNKSGAISQWTNDSGYLTSETDSQTLSFVTPNLSISGGNTVDISALTTGFITASSTETLTNKSGAISQWTNDSGYSTTTGTVTPSSTDTFTNKSGAISQWTNDSGYITSAPATDLTYTDATRVIASSTGTDATLPRAGTSTDGLMRARLNGTTAYLTYDGTVA